MVCEIYSDPPNDVSIAFHTSRGYRGVGHLRLSDGHEVVMMEKPLGSRDDAR
jgi:predicted GNAT superfamily acetyltransferase